MFDESSVAPYALGTGDRLRVIVFGQDNLSNVYAVDSTGCISMPLIDTVPVAGLTTQQVERAVEAKLRNGFIREPRVAVEVDAFRPFYILERLRRPDSTRSLTVSRYKRRRRSRAASPHARIATMRRSLVR